MVEVVALFAVETFGVMGAFAPAVDHIGNGLLSGLCNASASVSIAGTATSDHHIVDGIVVLFFDLIARIEQIVAQIVKLGKINSQIRHFQ